nr:thiamine pyrophosphate-binding protein [Nocardioides ungokensis]
MYDAAATGLLRLHTRIDERSAGFLAVGLARGGAVPAVMCTSGTAVANLHPAMAEAAHAGLPLVAVTADRPARLRGTSANQTTDQVGIFGPLVQTIDLAEADGLVVGVGDGPVHVNVQLEEPLVPGDRWVPPAPAARQERPPFARFHGGGAGDPLGRGPADGRGGR